MELIAERAEDSCFFQLFRSEEEGQEQFFIKGIYPSGTTRESQISRKASELVREAMAEGRNITLGMVRAKDGA